MLSDHPLLITLDLILLWALIPRAVPALEWWLVWRPLLALWQVTALVCLIATLMVLGGRAERGRS